MNGVIKRIIINNSKELVYELKISRLAKRLRIAIYCDGSVVVTAPIGMDSKMIENFLYIKSNWISKKLQYFKTRGYQPLVKGGRSQFMEHKEWALILAIKKVQHFSEFYNFKYNKIKVRNQKTRWGSCSRKGNLNFNYKIALLPEHLLDYIIVHELCHLGELNHSKRFWDLVGQTIPDYAQRRREIRKIA